MSQATACVRRALVPAGIPCVRPFRSPTTRSLHMVMAPLRTAHRAKGDYGFNVFHNSNPQHGGSYARHERRMRDDEVEDFMKSVKGWTLVREAAEEERAREVAAMEAFARRQQRLAAREASTGGAPADRTSVPPACAVKAAADADRKEADVPPEASPLRLGEEAIQRTFHFNTFAEAYLFIGRFWAFCYGCDKYPPVTWHGCDITVYLYSPSFHGLSKREARVAAFLNDQYNMLKKSRWQQEKILDGVAKTATVEELIGAQVQRKLAEREAARRAPLPEVKEQGPVDWEKLLSKSIQTE